MQVKKFEAPTIQEALDNIKKELGPEAIILQTRKNRRGFGLLSKATVEVTAAISERAIQKRQIIESRMPEPNRTAVKKLSAERQADIMDKYMDRNLAKATQTRESVDVSRNSKKITATRYIEIEDAGSPQPRVSRPPQAPVPSTKPTVPISPPQAKNPQTPEPDRSLEAEIQKLKKVIEELKANKEISSKIPGYSDLEAPILQEAFELLTLHGVERRYAYLLLKKVAFETGNNPARLSQSEAILDSLASELMKSVEVASLFPNFDASEKPNHPQSIVLAGPPGMGKTSTVAKLASEANLKRGLKVGLINLDQSKPGGFDQLGTYAKILNFPFRSAHSREDFRAAMDDFQSLDVILVDTGGFSKKDAELLNKTNEILQAADDFSVYLVISGSTREAEVCDAVNCFSALRPRGLIISKLDEVSLFGGIYNVTQKVKMPLVYFTTGQRIPEDIEIATRERLVSLVMDL